MISSDIISRGGKEKQLTILASGLIKRGYSVYIAVRIFQPENNYFSEYPFPEDKLFTYDSLSDFKKIILKIHPDIAVSWDGKSSVYHLITSRLYKYCFINGSIRHGIRLFKYSHFIRSVVAWLSPYVMANTCAGLRVNNMKPGGNRFILHNGVDKKFRYKRTQTEKEELLAKLFPGSRDLHANVFISTANFLPFKDYFTVLKALHKLKSRKPFYYLIIGDGPLKPEIIKMIRELTLDENIKLLGLVDNVEDFLAIGDYYIHSSRGEGMSNAVLEAMYAGLPIIATDVGGIPETVFNESSALFPYGDHEKLHEIMLHAEELFKSFNPTDIKYCKHLESFSIEHMISNFEDIIRKVNTDNIRN